jgi:predicted ArsR family transcriptional regulator
MVVREGVMEQNSTRKSIILLLKKSGGMSINALKKHLNITPMGIRQHLLALEKKGYVTFQSQKHGIGRPVFIYSLTEEAEKLFPRSYNRFALDILKNVEHSDGTIDIQTIFMWRKNSIMKNCSDALHGTSDMIGRIHKLQDMLESEGYLVDVTRNNGHYHLINYNCPIKEIAVKYQDMCRHELDLYKELISQRAVLKQSLAEGNVSCIFEFPVQ